MTDADGELVAAAALDAIAMVQERVPGNPALIGAQITLVLKTPRGIRLVSCVKEREVTA